MAKAILTASQLTNKKLSDFVQEIDGLYFFAKGLHRKEIINLAKHLIAQQFYREQTITNPETCKNYLILKLAECKREIFGILFLDAQNKVIAFEKTGTGSSQDHIGSC